MLFTLQIAVWFFLGYYLNSFISVVSVVVSVNNVAIIRNYIYFASKEVLWQSVRALT